MARITDFGRWRSCQNHVARHKAMVGGSLAQSMVGEVRHPRTRAVRGGDEWRSNLSTISNWRCLQGERQTRELSMRVSLKSQKCVSRKIWRRAEVVGSSAER